MDINEIIDKALEKDLRERTIGTYYISEIPYCVRKLWYMFKQPKDFNSKTKRIFERGNVWHAWIAKILSESDVVVHHEEEARLIIPDLKSRLVVRGRVDDFIIVEHDTKKYVLEIKTTANIWKQDSVSPHHLMQITPYLMIENCDGKVIYIDSRYLEVKSFDVKFEWSILEEIMRRARFLHSFLTKNELPPAESIENEDRSWECNFCLYKEECEYARQGLESARKENS